MQVFTLVAKDLHLFDYVSLFYNNRIRIRKGLFPNTLHILEMCLGIRSIEKDKSK